MRLLITAAVLLLPCIAFSQVEGPSGEALVRQAESAYHAQHYQESVALYRRSLTLLPESERAGTEYNMACSQALAGGHSEALATLEAAVQDGYADRKHTEEDKDLAWPRDRILKLVPEQTCLATDIGPGALGFGPGPYGVDVGLPADPLMPLLS